MLNLGSILHTTSELVHFSSPDLSFLVSRTLGCQQMTTQRYVSVAYLLTELTVKYLGITAARGSTIIHPTGYQRPTTPRLRHSLPCRL